MFLPTFRNNNFLFGRVYGRRGIPGKRRVLFSLCLIAWIVKKKEIKEYYMIIPSLSCIAWNLLKGKKVRKDGELFPFHFGRITSSGLGGRAPSLSYFCFLSPSTKWRKTCPSFPCLSFLPLCFYQKYCKRCDNEKWVLDVVSTVFI